MQNWRETSVINLQIEIIFIHMLSEGKQYIQQKQIENPIIFLIAPQYIDAVK